MQVPENIYEPTFDLITLSDEQRTEFCQHRLVASTMSPALAVFLSIITVGLFALIYYGLMHSDLPLIRDDDFRAGKAIGFMFIPFFNLYWQFRFWLRLVDRVNLQMRLRDYQVTISKTLMLWTIIIGLIPFANFAAIVMYPICIYKIQVATNKLAKQ